MTDIKSPDARNTEAVRRYLSEITALKRVLDGIDSPEHRAIVRARCDGDDEYAELYGGAHMIATQMAAAAARAAALLEVLP